MSIEPERGCGYRRVGALYLCGEFIEISCDRLPLPLGACPVCGGGIKVGRGFTKINPYQLWGNHQDCKDYFHPCFICDPNDEPAFIMGVGIRFYPTPLEFIEEARQLGISKRVPFLPRELELGKTVLYLAHPKAAEVKVPAVHQEVMALLGEPQGNQQKLLEVDSIEKKMGVFCAFIPHRVEQLVHESQLTDKKREELEKRGITPIPVPDGDKDHE